jgi:hypothetical protein
MTNSLNDSVQPARRRQAYGSILSEIRAVPKEQFVPITVDVLDAASTVLRVLPGIRALGAHFVESFIAFSIAKFERLETYALALEHSQTIYSTRTESRVSPVALARSAVKTRNILLSDVNALIARDLVSPTALKNLKGTNGYKNIASDLRSLAQISEEQLGDGLESIVGRARGTRPSRSSGGPPGDRR